MTDLDAEMDPSSESNNQSNNQSNQPAETNDESQTSTTTADASMLPTNQSSEQRQQSNEAETTTQSELSKNDTTENPTISTDAQSDQQTSNQSNEQSINQPNGQSDKQSNNQSNHQSENTSNQSSAAQQISQSPAVTTSSRPPQRDPPPALTEWIGKYLCPKCSALLAYSSETEPFACPMCLEEFVAGSLPANKKLPLEYQTPAMKDAAHQALLWSTQQLAVFLTSLNLTHLRPLFEAHFIDGKQFMAMDYQDFIEQLEIDLQDPRQFGKWNDLQTALTARQVLRGEKDPSKIIHIGQQMNNIRDAIHWQAHMQQMQQMHRMNQMNQMNHVNQMNQMNQMALRQHPHHQPQPQYHPQPQYPQQQLHPQQQMMSMHHPMPPQYALARPQQAMVAPQYSHAHVQAPFQQPQYHHPHPQHQPHPQQHQYMNPGYPSAQYANVPMINQSINQSMNGPPMPNMGMTGRIHAPHPGLPVAIPNHPVNAMQPASFNQPTGPSYPMQM